VIPKPQECDGCPLRYLSQGFSEPEGSGVNGVLLVGEALGAHEEADGLPFRPYAPAGHVLERAIRSIGHTREQYAIWNCVACKPPENELVGKPWEIEAIQHCKVHFRRIMKRYQPKVILALGGTAIRTLTGLTGKLLTVEMLQGFRIQAIEYENVWVICSWHPSYIAHGQWEVFPVLRRALLLATKTAKLGYRFPSVQYDEFANWRDLTELAKELEADPSLELSVDFESISSDVDATHLLEDEWLEDVSDDEFDINPERAAKKRKKRLAEKWDVITQVNLSCRVGTALVTDFPPDPDLRDAVQRCLSTPNTKVGHNAWAFDAALALKNGLHIDGPILDTMYCLRGDARIPLWDGGTTTISQIVHGKLKSTLIGMNEDKQLIPVKIKDWHKTQVKGQQWLRIKHNGGRFPIICTPDHSVWANDEWKHADEIDVGDVIRVGRGTPDLIEGSCLGDGHIEPKGNMLCICHGQAQKRYIQAKATNLGVGIWSRKTEKHGSALYTAKRVNKSYRRTYYNQDGSRRFVPPSSYRALAVWYMDDGCLSANKRADGAPSSHERVLLAINRYKNEAHEVLRWFKSHFGEDCALNQDSKILRISCESLEKFFNSIATFVHPSMDYKLPEKFKGAYDGWLENAEPQTAIVSGVYKAKPVGGISQHERYCVTVNHPTHRFFTAGGLVSNCFHWLYADLPGRKGKIGESKEEGTLANLQFCSSLYEHPWPWKHSFAERPRWYGANDADATLRVLEGVRREMQQMDVWDSYMEMVYDIWPILERMQQRGIPINRNKLMEFTKYVRGKASEVLRKIQPLVPEALKPIKQKHGLKRTPRDTEGLVRREFKLDQPEKCACVRKRTVKCSCRGLREPTQINLLTGELIGACEKCGGAGKYVEVKAVEDCEQCYGKGVLEGSVMRWAQPMLFKPTSPQQLKKYAHFRLHKIPKNSKRKYAMDKETLQRMAKSTGDPVYSQSIEYREFIKMYSTYGEGWMPQNGDNRIHSNFTFAPANGQLSSNRPNCQNSPSPVKYGELAELFADCIEAEPGHSLVEFDWKSYHAQTFAWEAKDWAFLRLAKLDIHSFLTAFLLKLDKREEALSWPDNQLMDWLKWIKKNHEKVRNKQAKPAILGYNLGMGARRLYDGNQESFNGVKDAQYVMDMLSAIFHIAAAYRANVPLLAHKQHYLMNPFKAMRWFWDVQTWDFREHKWTHGKDWDRATAFPCQSDAFCLKKKANRRLFDGGADEKYEQINDKHDSLIFHPPDELIEECIHVVKPEMERPSDVMLMPDGTGFWAEVEVKVGKTMKTMQEVRV